MKAPNRRLTERAYWDSQWEAISLPRCYRPDRATLYLNEILRVFHRYLPKGELKALEVGGAPGQYLAHLHRSLGYEVHCLDYSERGCAATRENFRLLGIPGHVYHGDLFDDELRLPRFDVVYSLGVIEHFTDPVAVVERHVRLLKPGGSLLLGVPNFLGINGWFLRRLAPMVMSQHELRTMDLDRWREFEDQLGLTVVFKGYVGGFEPSVFRRREQRSSRNAALYAVAVVLSALLSRRFAFLRRINGRRISGYAMAVYRSPDTAVGATAQASYPESVPEADHPMPHSEQAPDDAGIQAPDVGEQPKERDLTPGETREEPNPEVGRESEPEAS